MSNARRATVYLDPKLHRALRVRAAETDRSISDLVNSAVRQTLYEDAGDPATFQARAKEPGIDFEAMLRDVRRRTKR